MLKRRQTTAIDLNEDNTYSISVGDLMAGLLLIFVLMLSSVMLRLEGELDDKKTERERISERELLKRSIVAELKENISKKYDVEIDPTTGGIRIKDAVLFNRNRWNIMPSGQAFLRKFIPDYTEILLADETVRENLAKIVIEGHTDNRGPANYTYYQKYIYNLNLSLKRVNSVAEYIFKPEFGDFRFKEELHKFLSSNGRSFVEPCASNETAEGRLQNRRVEFKFFLKDWDLIEPPQKQFNQQAGNL